MNDILNEEILKDQEPAAEDLADTAENSDEDIPKVLEPNPEPQTPEQTDQPDQSTAEAAQEGVAVSEQPPEEAQEGVAQEEETEAEAETPVEQTEQTVVGEDELLYEQPEDEAPKVLTAYDRPGKWYVVSTTSGHEKLAKSNLETRIQSMNVMGKIFEVVIPMEEQVEFKGSKKEVVQKKVFPGYLLVRCHLEDETWHVIRNTPSITGFIGAGTKPLPLSRVEVETFLVEKGEGQQVQKKIRPRTRYEVGETVRVKEGPFTDFQGEVTDINEDQLKVKLLLNIFGRETPVELEFSQVSKQ